MNASTALLPQPKIGLRAAIVAGLTILALIAPAPWHAKLGFCLVAAGLFGSFPRPRINADCFEKEWFAVFVPVRISRMPLADLRQIETGVEERMSAAGGCALMLLFGLENLVMVWLLDWLIPWAGGDYKLWLRTRSGDRVLAWQGNGESNFRQNLEILEEVSGLPVTRG